MELGPPSSALQKKIPEVVQVGVGIILLKSFLQVVFLIFLSSSHCCYLAVLIKGHTLF